MSVSTSSIGRRARAGATTHDAIHHIDNHHIDKWSIYVSSVVGMMAFFYVAIGALVWSMTSLAWGVAVGGMCSLWAGPGFGLMLASARIALIEERLVPAFVVQPGAAMHWRQAA